MTIITNDEKAVMAQIGGNTSIEKVRLAVLEEAACAIEDLASHTPSGAVWIELAAATIRALKEKKHDRPRNDRLIAFARQLPEVRALVKIIHETEWSATDRNGNDYCPVCGAPLREGHNEGCELTAALAPFEEK